MVEKRKYVNRITKRSCNHTIDQTNTEKGNADDGGCKEKVLVETTLIELNSGLGHSDTRKTIILHRFPLQPIRAETIRSG